MCVRMHREWVVQTEYTHAHKSLKKDKSSRIFRLNSPFVCLIFLIHNGMHVVIMVMREPEGEYTGRSTDQSSPVVLSSGRLGNDQNNAIIDASGQIIWTLEDMMRSLDIQREL